MFESIEEAVEKLGEEETLKLIERQLIHEWFKEQTAKAKATSVEDIKAQIFGA